MAAQAALKARTVVFLAIILGAVASGFLVLSQLEFVAASQHLGESVSLLAILAASAGAPRWIAAYIVQETLAVGFCAVVAWTCAPYF